VIALLPAVSFLKILRVELQVVEILNDIKVNQGRHRIYRVISFFPIHSGYSFQPIPAQAGIQLLHLTIPAKTGIQGWGGDYYTTK
jgi:hypothetical protein